MSSRLIETDWALVSLDSELDYRETDSNQPTNTMFWTREHHTLVRVRLAPYLYDDTGLAILGPLVWCCGAMQLVPGGEFRCTADDSTPGDVVASHYVRTQTLERFTKWKKKDFSPTVATVGPASGYVWGMSELRNSIQYRETEPTAPTEEQYWRRTYSTLTRWVNEWNGAPSISLGAAVVGPVTRRNRADWTTPGGAFIVTSERYTPTTASREFLRREQTLERYGKWKKEKMVLGVVPP
jgi:hypothetical protein